MKSIFIAVFLFFVLGAIAQNENSRYKTKKIVVSADTLFLEKESLNPDFFEIKDKTGNIIDSTVYQINFEKAYVLWRPNAIKNDSLTISYVTFPEFLTKTYTPYKNATVVQNGKATLITTSDNNLTKTKPFDGLNTSGSISRGVTVGNNQNTVVNSNLDLQITGRISENVSLRASIQDSNIPLQDGGYSQKMDEFDQIFIELFSDKWSIRAGDLFLENRTSKFLNFNKKVQGLSTKFSLGKTNANDVFASAALVRGQYARSTFTGQEGNQGPYKLKGNNSELYVLVISGSERVYVNGILLERGENNDYTIDYNAGEITFTSLFPITSEMRINIEYQYTDRNFTRLVTYGGFMHESEKFKIGSYLYSENDVKNQPLQQNLSEEQVEVLKNAGDDPSLMVAPSSYLDSYSENKILYKKIIIGSVEAYEFSNNPDDELYNVRFTYVGANQGNYILANNNAVGKIYEYVGGLLGDYEPTIPLVAPTKIQMATVLGSYIPSEKTTIDFEISASNNDQNLYSTIDDNNNNGVATLIKGKQRVYTGNFLIDAFANVNFVQKDFKTIERLYNIEFNRDWNLSNPLGNQSLIIAGTNFNFNENGFAKYQLEKLDYSENFAGTRHIIQSVIQLKKTTFSTDFSAMQSESDFADSKFIRNLTQVKHSFSKNWVGGSFRTENNKEELVATKQFTALSQRFTEYGTFVGRGDSTKVYMEVGYLNRVNDSVQNNVISRVNRSNSYYLKSQLIKNEKRNLSVFAKYRNLQYEDGIREDEPSLNSRILYNDNFLKNLLQSTTTYENSSGTIAQQDFTYLEVDPGQGVYTWIDYNNNGIQELQEFEIAPFPDQATFVRVFLPNQVFVRTHQNRFSQALNFNGLVWQNDTGFKKFLSHFYNQFSVVVERKIKRNGNNFDFNPFAQSDEDLGINNSFRNNLFFNRGKQFHSVTYSYLNNHLKSLLNIGSQENKQFSHQLNYQHLLKKTWLLQMNSAIGNSKSSSENYETRNFDIDNYSVLPKMSYIFSKNASWDIFYEFKHQDNTINNLEQLKQNRLGTSFNFNSEKGFTLTGEYSYYSNDFTGNQLAPVAFQMLQGLQAGKNSVWSLLLQKNITQYLDININYQGRKSETSKTIHTGNVQLRAFF